MYKVPAPRGVPPQGPRGGAVKSSLKQPGGLVWRSESGVRTVKSVSMVYVRRVELAEKRSIQLSPRK